MSFPHSPHPVARTRLVTPEQLPQPTTVEPIGGMNTNWDGCYCGPDDELDQMRDLLRAGWTQQRASREVWGTPTQRLTDAVADLARALELLDQLLGDIT